MLEILVMYMDMYGLPRCHASGMVENNEQLDTIKLVASDMLDKYIAGKPYPLDRSEFSVCVEIVDWIHRVFYSMDWDSKEIIE